LHEPKGVSAAASGKVYVAGGSGSGTWSFQSASLTLDIASLDAVTDYYLVFPFAATITNIRSVIDGAVLTADKVLTTSLAGVAITGGVLTIPFTGSAAGAIAVATPSAANAIVAGAALRIVATGASTGAIRCHLTIQYQRTA